MTRRKAMSIVWLPALLAIFVPATILALFHQPLRHAVHGSEIAVRSASDDGGPGIFFLVFPLMMAGAIIAIVVKLRPTWGIGRRAALVAGVGAVTAVAAWLAAVGLDIVPRKPLLLAYAFLLTQLASVPSIAEALGSGPEEALNGGPPPAQTAGPT